jgi:hypothetical protein
MRVVEVAATEAQPVYIDGSFMAVFHEGRQVARAWAFSCESGRIRVYTDQWRRGRRGHFFYGHLEPVG